MKQFFNNFFTQFFHSFLFHVRGALKQKKDETKMKQQGFHAV